jgi:hypothetical protein
LPGSLEEGIKDKRSVTLIALEPRQSGQCSVRASSDVNIGKRRASVRLALEQKTVRCLSSLAHIHIPIAEENISGIFVKKFANRYAKKGSIL